MCYFGLIAWWRWCNNGGSFYGCRHFYVGWLRGWNELFLTCLTIRIKLWASRKPNWSVSLFSPSLRGYTKTWFWPAPRKNNHNSNVRFSCSTTSRSSMNLEKLFLFCFDISWQLLPVLVVFSSHFRFHFGLFFRGNRLFFFWWEVSNDEGAIKYVL